MKIRYFLGAIIGLSAGAVGAYLGGLGGLCAVTMGQISMILIDGKSK